MGVLCAWRRSSHKTYPWRSGHLQIFKVSHFGRLVALAMGVPDRWLKKGRKPGLKGKSKDKKGRKDKDRGNKNVSSLSEFLEIKDQAKVPV